MRSRTSLPARALLLALCSLLAAPAGARADTAVMPDECRVAIGVDAPPVGTGTCPGVRPGALVRSPLGYCTLNFLFTGSDGYRYMGTAGHCILEGDSDTDHDVGEKVWRTGGPVARDSTGRAIGRFVYAILKYPKDFALIRLGSAIKASARMCHFGGPTGTNTQREGAAVLHHYGNGLAIGEIVPARTHLAPDTYNPNVTYAEGVVMMGDSGSGVIDSAGRAYGVIVTVGPGMYGVLNTGVVGITRLPPQLARARVLLRLRTLRLATATLA